MFSLWIMMHKTTFYFTVGVSPPWERITYVPQDSIVHINCTANSSIHNPVWSILLSGTTAISQFSFPPSISLLNRRGFYEVMLPEVPGTLKIIQLLINITQGNNGTRIMCNDVVSSTLFSETNLIIVGKNRILVNPHTDSEPIYCFRALSCFHRCK